MNAHEITSQLKKIVQAEIAVYLVRAGLVHSSEELKASLQDSLEIQTKAFESMLASILNQGDGK